MITTLKPIRTKYSKHLNQFQTFLSLKQTMFYHTNFLMSLLKHGTSVCMYRHRTWSSTHQSNDFNTLSTLTFRNKVRNSIKEVWQIRLSWSAVSNQCFTSVQGVPKTWPSLHSAQHCNSIVPNTNLN